jgi:hypothetical protein
MAYTFPGSNFYIIEHFFDPFSKNDNDCRDLSKDNYIGMTYKGVMINITTTIQRNESLDEVLSQLRLWKVWACFH